MALRELFHQALDLLYPPTCVSCRKEGEWWCFVCRDGVDCPYGTVPPPEGVDALFVTGYYHDRSMRAALHALKYNGLTQIQFSLEAYLNETMDVHPSFPWSEHIGVQPLPTSARRVRSRGFDQAAVIADLVQICVVPGSVRLDLLRRNGSYMAQARLASPELRAANAKGSFSLRPNVAVPREVLLIDDVVTSGATMGEAARLLRAHGAEHVYGFAIALGK